MSLDNTLLNHYPVTTDDFQGVVVLSNGTQLTTGVKFAVVANGTAAPLTASFSTAIINGSQIGVRVNGFAVGGWDVYSLIVATGQIKYQGTFIIDP